MTPYVHMRATAEHLALFQRICRLVEALPDLDLGKDSRGEEVVLSCHMFARAFGRVLGLPWADGHFAKRFEHSWLYTPDRKWIIDAYPVGILGGPMLVENGALDALLHPGDLYVPRRIRSNGLFTSAPFRRSAVPFADLSGPCRGVTKTLDKKPGFGYRAGHTFFHLNI